MGLGRSIVRRPAVLPPPLGEVVGERVEQSGHKPDSVRTPAWPAYPYAAERPTRPIHPWQRISLAAGVLGLLTAQIQKLRQVPRNSLFGFGQQFVRVPMPRMQALLDDLVHGALLKRVGRGQAEPVGPRCESIRDSGCETRSTHNRPG